MSEADFTPEVRASAWWSGDSRLMAQGKAAQAILVKQGKMQPPDLSEVEAVQMGLKMQPIIARMAEDELGVRLKELDIAGTHPTEPWLRAHFDYVSEDNKFLVECKNYNDMYSKQFSDLDEPLRLPPADRLQCIHEAAVYGVNLVYLAVLFGGQRFRLYRIDVSDEEKLSLIKRAAEMWAHVKNGTCPVPSTPEESRIIWPDEQAGQVVIASQALEKAALTLRQLKNQIADAEEMEDRLTAQIQAALGEAGELRSFTGETLVTWKQAKGSKKFDAKAMKEALPDTYERFMKEVAGSRRFLVK